MNPLNYGIASSLSMRDNGEIVNGTDKMLESLGQSGHRIVPAITAKSPSTDKVFVAIRFMADGAFTAIVDTSLVEGDPTTIAFKAGDVYFGRITGFTANVITDAIEGV